MRIGFGWDATGRQRETAPSVDGEVLTDLEWQVWREVYVREYAASDDLDVSRAATHASDAVIRMRAHFSREIP